MRLKIKSLAAQTVSSPDGNEEEMWLMPALDREMTKKVDWESVQRQINVANGSSVLRGTFLVFLFIGILASVVGYVGCFSVVRGSRSSEALIWLGLEAALSVLRFVLWAINAKCDDAPPLEFKFKLDKHAPLPTCTKSAEEIEELKILPLVRATEFLEGITSYAGLLHRFSPPGLTLYYTLTRTTSDPNTNRELSPIKRVLYITIFDHTERTTRVYSDNYQAIQDDDDNTSVVRNVENTRSLDASHFYSADSVTIDQEHGILRDKDRTPDTA